MTTYQYTGEHHTVTIENIRFVKGEPKSLSDADEKNLLASGFGKAMIANGELVKMEDKGKAEPKSKAEPKPKTAESQ